MRVQALREALAEGEFGGKAVSLGQAIRAGLPVPDGVALDTELVDALAHNDGEARRLCEGLLEKLGAARVAVRSSAVGEDSAEASFAGQHSTVLNVMDQHQLHDAVKEVWSSGRTPAALAYRERLGLSPEPRVAVVVQKLVDAQVAGVLFTKNPVDGRDERVAEASWGLGEAVVSGLVTPDRYRWERGGSILERSPGEKDLELVVDPSGHTQERAVEGERVERLCLDESQLGQLERLAIDCEQEYEGASDIEFAFVESRLYLLQRRAVTR